jgi:hypothetical protein
MLLHQIRINYRDLSPTERTEAIHAYRAKRLAELETPILAKPKTSKKATKGNGASKPKLSDAEKALLKKLGVSLKALKAME